MSCPTINNLTAHLTWLLRERPFVPPPPNTPLIAVESVDGTAPSSSNILPAGSFSRALPYPDSNTETTPAGLDRSTANSCNAKDEVPNTTQQYNPTVSPVAIREKVRAEDMARLRSAPSSVQKSRMLSQFRPIDSKTPCT